MIYKIQLLLLTITLTTVQLCYSQLYDYYISESSKQLTLQNFDLAKFYANKAIHNDSLKPGGYYFHGVANYHEGNYKDALKYLKKSDSLKPKWSQTLRMLAIVNNELSDFKSSYFYYTEYIQLDSLNLEVLSNMAWIECKLEKYNDAERTLNKILKMDSINLEALNIYGLFYERQKNYIKAIEYFSRIIELDSNNATAYYNRCRNHAFLKNYPENCSDCKKANELGIEDALLFLIKKKRCD